MARAAGPAPVSGPTIKDYLSRDRPSLEEAAGIIASQQRRKECDTLAAYEEQLNNNYRLELKRRREKLLRIDDGRSKAKKKKKKKVKKHSYRERSRSRSPHSTSSCDSDAESRDPVRVHCQKSGHKKKHQSTSQYARPFPVVLLTEMEVEGSGPSSVLTSTPSSVNVSLHPLVVMNISDHFTRLRVQQEDASRHPKVYGALLGVQEGRNIEICNSFELLVNTVDDNVVHDHEYFCAKEKQFKQVFSSMEFLGWYSMGDVPTEEDTLFHKQLCADSENSLLLKLNPVARTSQLPINLYESLIEIIEAEPKILYTRVTYSLATEEAERVGVDHIARSSVAGSTQTSAVSEQLSAQYGAVKMLHSRARLVLDYLKAVQSGELSPDPQILREVSVLCNQLPVLDKLVFNRDFHSQTSEVLLVSYLAAITKGTATASEFVAKVNTVFDRHGVGRRTRGLLF